MAILSAKITTSSSFRSLSKVFVSFNLYLSLGHSTPSFSTAMLWVKKIGYSQLQLPKEKGDDWIIVVDESIGIGQEKVLVVLGIRRCNVDFSRPLVLHDMIPLLVKSKERWDGEAIAYELKEVKQLLGTVIYAVTDACSSLKSGLSKAGINHIYDITHAIAIALKKIYEKDPEFKEYTSSLGKMRLKLFNSRNAHLIPPNQRSKARFLNIDTLSKWGIQALQAIARAEMSHVERSQLEWVSKKEVFILELNKVMKFAEEISVILKNNGLSKKTRKQCINLLRQCKEGRLNKFRLQMINYLNENIQQVMQRGEKLLCCSDIIETTFGKYKNELGKNPMSGITDLVLIIPAFTSKLTEVEVKKAIDSCRVKDIIKWKEKNLCNTLMARRKAVYYKKRGETKLENI